MPSEPVRKKIVYIMGLGRSGTTLMDIVIGNGKGCFSGGELCRYPLRRGIRRNTPAESPRNEFWEAVLEKLSSLDHRFVEFERMEKLRWRYEYHVGYIRDSLLGLRQTHDLAEYHEFLRAFYRVLFEQSNTPILVESSKYPGRAWHLSLALAPEQYEITYLFIRRNPVSVTRSFQKRDIEQSSKNCFSAILLYFVVNTLCNGRYLRLSRQHRAAKVNFEALLSDPESCLSNVAQALDLDLDGLLEKVRSDEFLEVGNLFDGNRIRNLDEIKLRPPAKLSDSGFCDRLSWLINRRIYIA